MTDEWPTEVRNFASDDASETYAVGWALGREFPGIGSADPGVVILLSGPLGAGKTVLVQGLADGLDVVTKVKSPTFALEHRHGGRWDLYHFDLYRLAPGSDLDDLGLTELFDGPDIVAIEWPDRLIGADGGRDVSWPASRVAIKITIDWPIGESPESDRRNIRIEGPSVLLDLLDPKEMNR